ncbi:DoxX family protein [Streptomyces sp. NPDC048611]|uniref:DoxX family protein n=1 Tax=Streptomyces sp. NPDC048611 TaxID=3155635 RepID=UPI003423E89B
MSTHLVLTEQEPCVFLTYLAVTLAASLVHGVAAVANLTGHDYPRSQADKMGVPRSWVRPLGVLLGAGAAGLLVGIAVPWVGALAAGGLVLYFLGAFAAHLRAGDHHFGGWAVFFSLAVAALVLNLTAHGRYFT